MESRPIGRRGLLGGTLLATILVGSSACRAPEPAIFYLDAPSRVSLSRPPRWTLGGAEQAGISYRYLLAPKVSGDKEALSVTLIAPTPAASIDAFAESYLAGGTGVSTASRGPAKEWSFKDSAGVLSRLRAIPDSGNRYFGAWARGSEAAMREHGRALEALLDSMTLETTAGWPEETFAGMAIKAPASWTRGSRMSNATQATMQFKSPVLAVEKGNAAIHGYATLAKEAVPAPGDLEAYARVLRERETDIATRLERTPWAEIPGLDRPAGHRDFLRAGNTLTNTRVRRWFTARAGVGLIFTCEAQADIFDLVDPWCQMMADTVRFN